MMLYINPVMNLIYSNSNISNEKNNKKRIFDLYLKVKTSIQQYPYLNPIKFPKPKELMEFFQKIPSGSRVIFESNGDLFTYSQFNSLWQWTEEFLPDQMVEVVNEIYTRILEPELFDKYLFRFNSEQMSIEEMIHICRVLGVSYVITYTNEMRNILERSGYFSLAKVNLATIPDFLKNFINIPEVELNLFLISTSFKLISPPVNWIRKGNKLMWMAKSKQSYIVRYRYTPEFIASQNNKIIIVEPFKPFSDLPLKFMKLTAIADGEIILEFIPRLI
jgi:hypothetical protein